MSHTSKPKDLKKNISKSIKNREGIDLPYKKNTRKAVKARDARAAEWKDFKQIRQFTSDRRREAVENLHELHERLERIWTERGINVHHAENGDAACREIEKIIINAGADKILKSKSMLSEEIGINTYLEGNGIRPVETDLGEYIVQLRNESPSHITMPAMHLTREDVGKLFAEKLDIPYTDNPPELTKIARKTLREEFLSAKVGMCGVNFAVAETGHIITVTNEGNGRMVTSLPRVVIALMGWERVTQKLSDLAYLWQLLARSATGQKATVYLNMLAGPSQGSTGPDEVHIIVVDNGRKELYANEEMREVLNCIRCGACLNNCPVYQQIGGHPFGGTYPGPIGSVITPALFGLDDAPHHPFASTLCGACQEICPVNIPIPELMLKLRNQRVLTRRKDPEKPVWNMFEKIMSDQNLYQRSADMARKTQSILPVDSFPLPGWTIKRSAPKLAPKSFRELYKNREGNKNE